MRSQTCNYVSIPCEHIYVSLRTLWSKPADLGKGEYEFTLTEDKIFYTGKYQLNVGLSMAYGKVQLQYLSNIMTIEFEDYVDQRIAMDTKSGLIINQADFEIEPV